MNFIEAVKEMRKGKEVYNPMFQYGIMYVNDWKNEKING